MEYCDIHVARSDVVLTEWYHLKNIVQPGGSCIEIYDATNHVHTKYILEY
jgi:hypothetical protein